MVAGGDPQRGKGIGWYLRVQHVLPRRWVVVAVAGEQYINGRPLLRRTAARVELDLAGEGWEGQIGAWVSSLGARGGY